MLRRARLSGQRMRPERGLARIAERARPNSNKNQKPSSWCAPQLDQWIRWHVCLALPAVKIRHAGSSPLRSTVLHKRVELHLCRFETNALQSLTKQRKRAILQDILTESRSWVSILGKL